VRSIIEQDLVPADVTIQVVTQAREELIACTFESLRGARRAIVDLYNSISTAQRERVCQQDRAAIRQLAVHGHAALHAHAMRTGHRVDLRILFGELHRDRTRLCGGGDQRGRVRVAPMGLIAVVAEPTRLYGFDLKTNGANCRDGAASRTIPCRRCRRPRGSSRPARAGRAA
jgi:hypothetical protein